MLQRFVACLALLLAVVSGVSAQPGDKTDPKKTPGDLGEILKSTPEEFLKRYDTNKDSFLSKEEAPPVLASRFEKIDRDGDGMINLAELTAAFRVLRAQAGDPRIPEIEKMVARYMELDANKDGKISREEAKAKLPVEIFAKADTNRDGFLDRDELRRLAAGRAPRADPKGERQQVEMIMNRMMQMDTNKDGKLSRQEAMGPVAARFDMFDANKDGFLDRDEVRRLAQQLVGQQKGGPPIASAPGPIIPDFDPLDKNADGRLTREELEGTRFLAQFDQIDSNRDGRIDRREFESYYRRAAAKKE